MKKLMKFFPYLFLGLFLAVNPVQAAENVIEKMGVEAVLVDQTNDNGWLEVSGKTSAEKIKMMITYAGKNTWLDIEIDDDGMFQKRYYCSQGIGEYQVSIMINLEANRYCFGPQWVIENDLELNPYLYPEKHIESDREEIKALSFDLLEGKEGALAKAETIYQWVTENIHYDYDLLNKQKAGIFLNDYGALKAYESRAGVCYDFSTLYAALGRAAGLEVKLVKGIIDYQGREIYHAWNEVYIPELQQWVILDTTMGRTTGKNYFNIERKTII